MITILAFGGGVDSTALLLYHLFVKSLGIRHVLYADTGAETTGTYRNIARVKRLCTKHDIPFTTVRHKKEPSIYAWVTRLGVVPLMPGSKKHVCSVKFKGKVMDDWCKQNYQNKTIEFIIGIEAGEVKRLKRFTKPPSDKNKYRYPLVELNMYRQDCIALLEQHGFRNVPKSACVFCPYTTLPELIQLRSDPKAWAMIKKVEHTFQLTSPIKHKRWLDAGKPLNRADIAPVGMWSKDSWESGARLFAKRIDGRQLSVSEWEQYIDTNHPS